jgi:hypothetical protein
MLGLVIVIGSTRSVPSVTKGAPHWVVKQIEISAFDPARFALRHRFAHDGMEPIGRYEAVLEWINIEVSNHDGPCMTNRCFLFQHGSGEQ